MPGWNGINLANAIQLPGLVECQFFIIGKPCPLFVLFFPMTSKKSNMLESGVSYQVELG
jgi:hypothetical protein